MKTRVTTEVIRSGQPRPYADSEYVCRVMFEKTTAWGKSEDDKFEPFLLNEKNVTPWLKNVMGFTVFKKGEVEWFDTYLDYVKPIDADHAGLSNVWEFRTVTAFTD